MSKKSIQKKIKQLIPRLRELYLSIIGGIVSGTFIYYIIEQEMNLFQELIGATLISILWGLIVGVCLGIPYLILKSFLK